jgi:outer membrane protein OmpA-like peptidoglycan-associated protein
MSFKHLFKVIIFAATTSILSSCACICPDGCETATTFDLGTSTAVRVGATSDSGTAGRLQSIHFDFKEFKPIDADIPAMQENLAVLKNAPSMKVIVEGHGDAQGNPQGNLKLSERRARVVYDYLIAPERLEIRALGSSVPLSEKENPSKLKYQKDRRVNFLITEFN